MKAIKRSVKICEITTYAYDPEILLWYYEFHVAAKMKFHNIIIRSI